MHARVVRDHPSCDAINAGHASEGDRPKPFMIESPIVRTFSAGGWCTGAERGIGEAAGLREAEGGEDADALTRDAGEKSGIL